mmetsp:Transcript_6595/g.26901  ORF Transcript_6595/g.26901 Transcript_6595/m.26901 type:complete len:234 (+) Transcript_6595:1130-1831(+)
MTRATRTSGIHPTSGDSWETSASRTSTFRTPHVRAPTSFEDARSSCGRERPRSSERVAQENRRSRSSCKGCTRLTRDASSSMALRWTRGATCAGCALKPRWCRKSPSSSRPACERTFDTVALMQPMRKCARRPARPTPTTSSKGCQRDMIRSSRRRPSAGGRSSASQSLARSCAIRGCCCSTRPPRRWIQRARRSCRPRSTTRCTRRGPQARRGRCSSSRTACRPCARRTTSW